MKIPSILTLISKFLFQALAILILFSLPALARATDTASVSTSKAEITYYNSGNDNEALFNVHYQVEHSELLTFTVSDREGYIFYEENIKGNVINKKFLFKDLGNQRVHIVLTFKSASGSEVEEIVLGK